MSVDSLANFIESVSHDPTTAWDYPTLTTLAGAQVPTEVFGDQDALLKGDQHRLWLRWYLEGLVSPMRAAAVDPPLERLDIFSDVASRVKSLHSNIDRLTLSRLADTVTNHLWSEVQRIRQASPRDSASLATRIALLASSTTPRCYICGYAFSAEAISLFRKVKGAGRVQCPAFVDVLQPRGLIERDISIEIEHVVPVAAGGHGQDNLRLACGWCNKHKSSRVSIYEASFVAPQVSRFSIGGHRLHELPHPFWVVRVLALRGRCQHIDGCSHTAKTSELHVALSDWRGSPNPTNLAIFCTEHDPIRGDRHQDAKLVRPLWENRKRN